MKAIGGYFELADYEQADDFPHKDGILLNTGRNALEFILRSIKDIKRIYLPYFTCEVVLEPINKLNIPFQFYHINERLEIEGDIKLYDGEYLIANNYFGIKDKYIHDLAEYYHEKLIVDCAQAFFAKAIPGIKMFFSCRKFVGVADGGIAYLPNCDDLSLEFDEDITSDHDSHLYIRKQFGAEAGFKEFQANECKLDDQPIELMSQKSQNLIRHIDYDKVCEKRIANFTFLHKVLGEANQLTLPLSNIPLIYPYWVSEGANLRSKLISNKVFCARYWPNIFEWCAEGCLEYELVKNLVAIPCDQRYGDEDMERIISLI